MSRYYWLSVALFVLCALLGALEFWAYGQLSSDKTNAMECWPHCTFYEDLIRTLTFPVLPAAILLVAGLAFVALRRSIRR